MANSIFPPLSFPVPAKRLCEFSLEGDTLRVRGPLKGKSVVALRTLLGERRPARVLLSELEEVDGAGFAFLVSLGLEGTSLLHPPRSFRTLLEKSRLFEVLEVEYE